MKSLSHQSAGCWFNVLALCFLVIMPSILLRLNQSIQTHLRLIFSMLFLLALFLILSIPAINWRKKIIGDRAQLTKNAKRVLEYASRLFLLAIAIGLFFLQLIPLLRGIFDLYIFKKQPAILEVEVISAPSPLYGLWFIHQSFIAENGKEYSIYFPLERINKNNKCIIKRIPHGNILLSYQKYDEDPSKPHY